MPTRQRDVLQFRIGSCSCILQGLTGCHHIDHAATRAHQPGGSTFTSTRGSTSTFTNTILSRPHTRCPHTAGFASGIRAGQGHTSHGSFWVSFRGQHDCQRITVFPFQFRKLIQGSRGYRVEHATQGSLQELQHCLGFGVTETTVEFHHAGAVLAPGKSGIQQPVERNSVCHHLCCYGNHNFIDDALHSVFRQPRQWGVRAHATGVWSGVIVSHALVILGGQQRNHGFAIYQAEQAHFWTVQEAFQQHWVATGVDRANMLPRLHHIIGDHHSLAPCQAIILHHIVRAEAVQGGVDLLLRSTHCHLLGPCGLDPGARHGVFRKLLGAFNLSGLGGGAENGETGLPQLVSHTIHQGDFRPNDHQIRSDLAGQGNCISLRVQRGDGTHTGVTWAHVNLGDLRIAGQRVGQGVLTGTVSNHKNAHGQQCSTRQDTSLQRAMWLAWVNMTSVFTKIIEGEIPGRFVYRDDEVAAFLTIQPVAYGHTLVVPIKEVDKWTDLDPQLWARCNEVAQKVGQAIIDVFGSERAGYLIAGFEVPHAHIHVFPANDMSGYSLSNVMSPEDTDPAKMDEAAEKLSAALAK